MTAFVVCAGLPVAAAEIVRVERVPSAGVTRPLGDWRAPSEPPWGLALGGGGAWGLAHLGFLEAMEQDGLRPRRLAGTSAGALAGAAYAAGIPTREIAATFREAERDPRQSLVGLPGAPIRAVPVDPLMPQNAPIRFGPGEDGRPLPWRGLFSEDKLSDVLARFFARASADADGDLDRLHVPFRAVAADLAANETYAPRHGSLPLLVRASISVPVFPPVRIGDRVLVDGGVFEEVPVPTLRALGAEPVIGVRLTANGEDFGDLPEKFRFSNLNDLYTERIVQAHRRDVVEASDVRVDVRVGDVSQARFLGQLDRLLAAGSTAWHEHREEIFRALAGPDPETVRIARVEAYDPADAWAAAEVAARIGVEERAVDIPRVRVEIELVRLLRRGLGQDASVEVGSDGTAVLHVAPLVPVRDAVLDAPVELAPWIGAIDTSGWPGRSPRAAVADVEAAVLEARRAGLFLAGIASVDWRPETGALEIVVDAGTVGAVRLRTLGEGPEGRPRAVPDRLRSIEGETAELDRLRGSLDALASRDLVHGARIADVRPLDGGRALRIDLEAEAPAVRRTTVAFGVGDSFVPTVLVGLHRPGLRGSTWGLDGRVAAGREGVTAGAEFALARERGVEPYVRAAGGRPVLPLYDAAGGSNGRRWMSSAGAGSGVRWRETKAGAFEVGLAARWASESAMLEIDRDEAGVEGALEAAWSGRVGDDPFEPLRFLEWQLEVTVPFAGRSRAAAGSLDIGGHVRVGERRRWGIDLLGRAASTATGEPLPLDRWPEAGAWIEAPGLAPGRSRSREVLRATAIVRRSLGMLGPLPVQAGISAASWRIDDIRVDPALPRSGSGAAIFVQVGLPRAGALSLGWARADFDGDAFFVLLDPTRIPWPGIRLRHPGQ